MLTQAHADFLTDEQRMVRDMARDFARAELAPNAARWDEEGYVPDATLAKMGELGLMDMLVPEEWGGTGADYGMQFVDERDDLTLGIPDLVEYGLQPLLELTAILGAGDH